MSYCEYREFEELLFSGAGRPGAGRRAEEALRLNN